MTDSWAGAGPSRATPPLSEDYPSDADWFLPVARIALAISDPEFEDLEAWQIELFRRALETFPEGNHRAGQLRWRQVVISLGRQNGKSILGMLFALYALLKNPLTGMVIGLASSAEQARIVYVRTLQLISANPGLAKRFAKLTDTRGIRTTQGATFEVKAAKSAALQGLALSLGVVDELHLLKAELWNALVSGTGGRPNTLVVGITTAGDEDSELLKQLYATGEKALAGDSELDRFGFFVWEAPEARVPSDKTELVAYLRAANPSLASGRLDMQIKLADIATLPETEIIRYHLNRFVSSVNSFISPGDWALCGRGPGEEFPREARGVVFTIDRTPDWEYATITATVKVGTVTHSEIVASIVKPTLDQLTSLCNALYRHSPITFAMDSYSLKALGLELKKYGLPVTILGPSDILNASSMTYSKIMQRKLKHGFEPLLSQQIPGTKRKNYGESYRISKGDSSLQIDAVMATAIGLYVAETQKDMPVQIF